jgi:uncharacterized membrane protein
MSDSGRSQDDLIARYLAPGGDNVKLVYILYLASFVIGISVLVGLVVAYMNRPGARGSWVESHYTYQIRTVWIGLLYALLSTILMVVGVGFLLLLVIAVWGIVRCVRGLQWAARGMPVPDPESWTV